MLSLIIKDFRAQKQYLLLLFIMIAGFSAGFNIAQRVEADIEVELYILAVVLSTLFASKLFTLFDFQANAALFFAALPVTRKQMVIAAYSSSALLAVVTLSVHYIAVVLSSTELLRAEHSFMYEAPMWIFAFVIMVLTDAFSFPFSFKYGLVKGSFFYGCFFITLIITAIITINTLNPAGLIYSWFNAFLKQSPVWIISQLIVFGIIILGTSIFISMRTYQGKDL